MSASFWLKAFEWVMTRGQKIPIRPAVLVLLFAVPATAGGNAMLTNSKADLESLVEVTARVCTLETMAVDNREAHATISAELKSIHLLLERNHEDTLNLFNLLRTALSRSERVHAEEHTDSDTTDR